MDQSSRQALMLLGNTIQFGNHRPNLPLLCHSTAHRLAIGIVKHSLIHMIKLLIPYIELFLFILPQEGSFNIRGRYPCP